MLKVMTYQKGKRLIAKKTHSLEKLPVYLQPSKFADYLLHWSEFSSQDYCLLLDIDGTLAEFTLDPKDSFIPDTTLKLLQQIQNFDTQIAIVTGRSLVEAQQMLAPLHLSIAATHGLEIAFATDLGNDNNEDNSQKITDAAYTIENAELNAINQAITQSCASYPELLIENKPYSVALHYRQHPDLADIAHSIMSKTSKNYNNWRLKQGKYVWEIAPRGADKGIAIVTMLKKMHTTHKLCPIFIGDDVTDEAGFIAVQHDANLSSTRSQDYPHKGMGVKVGNEPTSANYYVNNIAEVTALLESFLSFCQKRVTLSHANRVDGRAANLGKTARPIS